MGKFSSEEVESQYNLLKMILAETEKYRDGIIAIKKILNICLYSLKKLEEEKIILWIANGIHHDGKF